MKDRRSILRGALGLFGLGAVKAPVEEPAPPPTLPPVPPDAEPVVVTAEWLGEVQDEIARHVLSDGSLEFQAVEVKPKPQPIVKPGIRRGEWIERGGP